MRCRFLLPAPFAPLLSAMAGAMAITLASGVVATPALAGPPGFDCMKAEAPVERLICSDPVLAEMDGRLALTFSSRRKDAPTAEAGKALLDDQRQWLRQRLEACNVRRTGDAPTDSERWAWAGCLVNQYQQRLGALQAPPPEYPPGPPSPRSKQPGFVHPWCLEKAMGGMFAEENGTTAAPVDLKACNAGFAHIAAEDVENRPGALGAAGMEEGSGTWISYEPVGHLPGGDTLAIVVYNGGGTGYFSSLVSWHLDSKGILTASQLAGGGDRCNGGITSAGVEGSTLTINQTVTPADVGSMMGLDDGEDNLLPSCAICCVGTQAQNYTLPLQAEAEGTAGPLTIDSTEALTSNEDPHSPERCLLSALKTLPGGMPYTLTQKNLEALKAPYLSCVQAGKQGSGKKVSP